MNIRNLDVSWWHSHHHTQRDSGCRKLSYHGPSCCHQPKSDWWNHYAQQEFDWWNHYAQQEFDWWNHCAQKECDWWNHYTQQESDWWNHYAQKKSDWWNHLCPGVWLVESLRPGVWLVEPLHPEGVWLVELLRSRVWLVEPLCPTGVRLLVTLARVWLFVFSWVVKSVVLLHLLGMWLLSSVAESVTLPGDLLFVSCWVARFSVVKELLLAPHLVLQLQSQAPGFWILPRFWVSNFCILPKRNESRRFLEARFSKVASGGLWKLRSCWNDLRTGRVFGR